VDDDVIPSSALDVPDGRDEEDDGYPVVLVDVPISEEDTSELVEEVTTPSALDVPEGRDEEEYDG
jgi:hypothetical protein